MQVMNRINGIVEELSAAEILGRVRPDEADRNYANLEGCVGRLIESLMGQGMPVHEALQIMQAEHQFLPVVGVGDLDANGNLHLGDGNSLSSGKLEVSVDQAREAMKQGWAVSKILGHGRVEVTR